MTATCPACKTPGAEIFLDIRSVPVLCNVLWPTAAGAWRAPRGQLRLALCRQCGLIFNDAYNANLMSYTPGYENSLHVSSVFRRYADDLATRLVDRYARDKAVMSIGCGHGEFLALLCEKGAASVIGFDPSFDGPRPHERVDIVRETFDGGPIQASLVEVRHILEHVDSPTDFLRRIRSGMNGFPSAVYCEVPNMTYTMRYTAIWDLIYEHATYFSTASLSAVFALSGFEVTDAYPSYGDQFIAVEARPSTGMPTADGCSDEVVELATGLAERRDELIAAWQSRILAWRQANKSVALWGAGSKGVTFLNHVDRRGTIKSVVDVNPRKQGKFVPGTGHAVVPPAALAKESPDVLLVMNPIYSEEIRNMLTSLDVQPEMFTVTGAAA